jgi:hypothetical protein
MLTGRSMRRVICSARSKMAPELIELMDPIVTGAASLRDSAVYRRALLASVTIGPP